MVLIYVCLAITHINCIILFDFTLKNVLEFVLFNCYFERIDVGYCSLQKADVRHAVQFLRKVKTVFSVKKWIKLMRA